MLNGTKATPLPNEANDVVKCFSDFVFQQADEHDDLYHDYACDKLSLYDAVDEVEVTDEDISDALKTIQIIRSMFEKQHFTDVDAGLYDDVFVGFEKVPDDGGHRELFDPDNLKGDCLDMELDDEGYWSLVDAHGHL